MESDFKASFHSFLGNLGESRDLGAGTLLGFSDPVGFPCVGRKTGSVGTERRRRNPSGYGGHHLRALGIERKSQPGPVALTRQPLMLKLSM